MNCIIVEDEPLAREGMRAMVKENSALSLCGCFNNASSALDFLHLNTVDLVFLDIEMSGINGLELARSISSETMIVFTTAYSEYALESYDVQALDYLVKPIRRERFLTAVAKAAAQLELMRKGKGFSENLLQVQNDYMFVRADRKYYKVIYNKLYWVEGLKDYVILHYDGRKLITSINLKNIYEQLPMQTFVRVSKSCIVNIQFVDSFDQHRIVVAGEELAVGDVYKDHFFNEFIKRKLIHK